MKKQLNRIGLTLMALVLSSAIFYSCKKNTSDYVTPGPKFSNTEMTTATFMGQVIKEDGTPLDGATVSTGTHMMTSDADGFFYFSNISTPKNATLIKVEKVGYFKAFRTIQVIANEDNQTRIMVMELPNPEILSASAGGTITIANGGSIEFPANAIVDEATNQPYTGSVNVYAKWIDPSSNDLPFLIPGALRGINEEEGVEEGLTTYGMQAVELVGSAGQALQLGNGQTAKVTFPLPSSLAGVAPVTVPLWHFDEAQGMWVEDGEAVKSGSDYVGSVAHFSFWNCDYGGPIVTFTCQLVDASNNPIVGGLVRITPTSTALTARSATTNSSGTVLGGIPVNATFDLSYIPTGCSYSSPGTFIQSFSSTTANINLGTISVVNNSNPSTITGVVQDCNNVILANAPVKLTAGSHVYMTLTDATGAFSFTQNCMTSSAAMTITAYDVANSVQGSSNITLLPNSTLNAGTIQACGTLNGFVNWSSNDGTTTSNASIVELVSDSYFSQSFQNNTFVYVSDSALNNFRFISMSFDGPQTVAGVHNLISYNDHFDVSTTQNISGTPLVTLTNYQAIGGWIEGSYTATITSLTIPSRTVICNFRVPRQQ